MVCQPVIAIDGSRAFDAKRTGTENYSYQIIRAIASGDCQERLRLYLKAGQKELVRDRLIKERYEICEIGMGHLWTQVGLALRTWQDRPDVLFIPAHVVPFIKNPAVPAVVTVHDLRTEFLPQHQSWLQRVYLNPVVEFVRAQLASHVIAVSRSTQADVFARLRVPLKKITVVYEGIDRGQFPPDIRNDCRQAIVNARERYANGQRYLLFVGTVQPRKNLVRLIEAFARIVTSDPDIVLLIAGKKGWLSQPIYDAPDKFGVSDSVRFIDYVADKDLPILYAGAELFVFPSLYEGFGLPILESLSVGTPVVTSNVASMPEVGGNFVHYVDPTSVESIYLGINQGLKLGILNEENLSHHLAQFTWNIAAEKTLAVLRQQII